MLQIWSQITIECMEASLPDDTLRQLATQLFRRHLIVSIPAMLLILVSMLVIPLVIQQYDRSSDVSSNPSLTLGSHIDLHYSRVVQYVKTFGQTADMLWNSMGIPTSNSTLDNQEFAYQIYCLSGSSCYKFTALSALTWQHQDIDRFGTIQRIVFCSKQDSTCVGTRNSDELTDSELSLLSQPNSTTDLSVVYQADKLYIVQQTEKLTILTRLSSFSCTMTSLIESCETTFISYYSVDIQQPVGLNSFPIVNGVAPSNPLHEHIQIRLTEGTVLARFFVQYAKVSTQSSPIWIMYVMATIAIVFFVAKIERNSVQHWVSSNFDRKQLINKLYKYTIRDVFINKSPPISNALQRGPCCELMKTLSELMDSTITPILLDKPEPTPKQPFKFSAVVADIIDRYKEQIKGIMVSKSNYVLANRFNIQTHVNDMCEEQMRVIRGLYARADRLGIQKQFFKFAYLALLKRVDEFESFLKQDDTPLPNKLLDYFLEINRKIHKVEYIWEKINIFPQESDSPPTPSQYVEGWNPRGTESAQQQSIQENKQELEFRIRVFLIPKCITIIRELDSKDNYARELGLEKQLKSLGDIIENTRHMLTRHNKSIRCFCK